MSTPYKVLICGCRDFPYDAEPIVEAALMRHLGERDLGTVELISGGAPGADTIAERIAARLGIPITVVPADWKKYGRAAGPIRNRQMADLGPDHVLAFLHIPFEKSKGTRSMITIAREVGLPGTIVHVHTV